jgi:hypothetical protein
MSDKKYSDELLKKASELKQSYHKDGNKTDWSEVEEILQQQGFDIECNESFRCAVKRWEDEYGILKKKEEYKTHEIESAKEKLIEQKFELDTKIQEFRDERNYLNKIKRPISRTENMTKVLEEITPTIPIQSPYIFIKPNKNKRVIIPLVSDGQVGELVKIEDTGGFNTYNFETFKRRQQYYFNEIINDAMELGIDEAYIPFLGDDVEGNGKIYKRQKFYLESHIVEQIFKVSESNAWFLQSLNEAGIKKINSMAVCGNHGNDDYDNHAQANFDVLAFDRTKLLLRDNKNIDYKYSQSYMEVVNILGYHFLIIHGDGMNKSTLENAFYRYSYMYASKGIQLYGLLCGHFHTPLTLDVMSTAGDIIVNGNIVGSNHLSVQKLQSDNKPSQIYIVIEENKGITYKRKVVLPD